MLYFYGHETRHLFQKKFFKFCMYFLFTSCKVDIQRTASFLTLSCLMSGTSAMQCGAQNDEWQVQLTAYHGLYHCLPHVTPGI